MPQFLNRERDSTCHSDGFMDELCEISLIINSIITFNGIEGILLYFCFKAIKKQDEDVRELIGENQYLKRKRFVHNC